MQNQKIEDEKKIEIIEMMELFHANRSNKQDEQLIKELDEIKKKLNQHELRINSELGWDSAKT